VSRKTVGVFAIVGGIAVIVVSALADLIGVGPDAGFGFQQISGVVFGVLLVAFGWLFGFRGDG
jgi:hypothetical protein